MNFVFLRNNSQIFTLYNDICICGRHYLQTVAQKGMKVNEKVEKLKEAKELEELEVEDEGEEEVEKAKVIEKAKKVGS